MATWTNTNKSTSPSFLQYLKHGSATRLSELANFTFNDVVFPDGTILKDVTFDQLVDVVWTNISKSASPSFSNVTRN